MKRLNNNNSNLCNAVKQFPNLPLYVFVSATLLLTSCKKKQILSTNFGCEQIKSQNLETVNDFKNTFSIQLPKNWKTSLYHDEIQTSIFSADSTKQLTETVLIDVSLVQKKIQLNEDFKLQQEQENLRKNLVRTSTKKVNFLNKPSVINTYVGKVGKYTYKKNTIHTFLNDQNFLIAKIEVYGDSLKAERICNAIQLIETIQLNQ